MCCDLHNVVDCRRTGDGFGRLEFISVSIARLDSGGGNLVRQLVAGIVPALSLK